MLLRVPIRGGRVSVPKDAENLIPVTFSLFLLLRLAIDASCLLANRIENMEKTKILSESSCGCVEDFSHANPHKSPVCVELSFQGRH